MVGLLDKIKGLFKAAEQSAEERALIEQILQCPDDDAPRLAYADWLAERGDPRGDFIRVDCEMEGLDEADPRREPLAERYNALISKHGKKWVKPLGELGLRPMFNNAIYPSLWFERGMIEHLTIDKRGAIPGNAEKIFELAPTVRRLTIERCSPDFAGIARCPQMSRVIELNLSGELKLSIADLQLLLGSPHFAQLRVLRLDSKPLGEEMIDAIIQSKLSRLEVLDLNFCELDGHAIAKLVGSDKLATLKSLGLNYNRFDETAAQVMAASPHLQNLETLTLDSNRFGPAASRTLAAAQLPRLRRLSLEQNELGRQGLENLLSGSLLAGVEDLSLAFNDLQDGGLRQLAASPSIGKLCKLSVYHNEIGPEGLQALLDSPYLGPLANLDVGSNPLGSSGIQLLLDSPKLNGIRQLTVRDVQRGQEDASEDLQALIAKFGRDVVRD